MIFAWKAKLFIASDLPAQSYYISVDMITVHL